MNPKQKQAPTIIDVMNDPELFGPWFSKRWFLSDTWAMWRVFLKALYGLPMAGAELEIFKRHTGRTTAPTEPFKKAWLVCGRRSGKSRIAALMGTYNSVFRKYPELQRGEVGVMPITASDRKQADVIFGYVADWFREIPLLAKMVISEMKDSLWLSNNTRIEIQTCDHRSVRGFTMLGGVLDEIAFWPTDANSSSPDVEVINAVEKGSANIPSAMLLGVSSPYAMEGALWEAYEKHYGKDDSDELVWKSDSRSMNPTLSQRIITRAYEKDPQQAAAEYGGEFRSDVANFLTPEAIAACVFPARYELAPRPTFTYLAFCDPSGGSSDSMTLAIAHHEHGVAMLDLIREVVPPFSPEQVVKDFAGECKRFHCYSVTGDHYAAEWCAEQFEKAGVVYQHSELSKSDIYLSLLPAVNSRQVELLDNRKLTSQLAGLERRTRSGGKDIVDHRPGLHDDVANAAAGSLTLVQAGAGQYGLLDYDRQCVCNEMQNQDFKAVVSERANDKVAQRIADRAAALKFAINYPGVKLTEQQGGNPEPACPTCANCGHATQPIGKTLYWCNQCSTQTGTPDVMYLRYDRSDIFAGNVPGRWAGNVFRGRR